MALNGSKCVRKRQCSVICVIKDGFSVSPYAQYSEGSNVKCLFATKSREHRDAA